LGDGLRDVVDDNSTCPTSGISIVGVKLRKGVDEVGRDSFGDAVVEFLSELRVGG